MLPGPRKPLKRTAFKRGKKKFRVELREREAKRKRVAERIKLGQDWRRIILDRDNMTCRLCGIKAVTVEELDAHHIAMRSRRPDLKFCIYNGAALHRKCHDWVHRNQEKAQALGLLSSESYEKERKNGDNFENEPDLQVGLSMDGGPGEAA